MPEIIKEGFLSAEYNGHYEIIRKKYRKLFDISKVLNKLCHKICGGLNERIGREDYRQIALSILFVKLMTCFQAVIINAKKGMKAEANCMLRVFIETLFWFMAIIRKDDFYKLYFAYADYRKLSSEKRLLDFYPTWHNIAGGTEKLKEHYEQSLVEFNGYLERLGISKNELKDLDVIYKIAEHAQTPNDHDLFTNNLVIYSLLSNDVHSNANCLRYYFTVDDFDNIQSVHYGPDDEDVERVLICSNTNMLVLIDELISFFGLDIKYKKRLQEIEHEFHALRIKPD